MRYEKYSNLVLRLGLGFVFLWFGIDKFFSPEAWFGWIPPFAKQFIFLDLKLFMYLLGIVETVLGILLAIGLFTRFAAIICSLFLLMLVVSFGINEIMVRDVGLLSIAVSLFLSGAKEYSIDNYWRLKK